MNIKIKEIIRQVTAVQNSEEIDLLFRSLVRELESYLKLESLYSLEEITIKEIKKSSDKDIFHIGANKNFENRSLKIEFLKIEKKYLPFIFLREAYYCFLPFELIYNYATNICINQIIENDLADLNNIDKWKIRIRESIVDYAFLRNDLDRLDKFFKLESPTEIDNPSIFFFNYLRMNAFLIDFRAEDIYNKIFKIYVYKSSKAMRNDEIAETIRILTYIFYRVKSYRALLDYQKYFSQFKESNELQTFLGLRAFNKNMKWITNYTYIAPSYRLNDETLGISSLFCILRFNPGLRKNQIEKLVTNLPFFWITKSSELNFAIDVSGFFRIPNEYIRDLSDFLKNLEDFGYITDLICQIRDDSFESNLNLNYFREFYLINRIINPNHKNYDNNYEIMFKLDSPSKLSNLNLTIIDFLTMDRLWRWGITGFSFEKRAEAARLIKSDLLNIILSQRNHLKELKKCLTKICSNEILKKNFVDLINHNKNFGFFFIKELLENLLYLLELFKSALIDSPHVKNSSQLKELLERGKVSRILKDRILIKNPTLQKVIFKEYLPLYFQNKKIFDEKVEMIKIFSSFFRNTFNLKIFNLNAIIRIIEEADLRKTIYSTKETKLKKINLDVKGSNITSNYIDDLLDIYLNSDPPIIKPILISTINTTNFAKYYGILVIKDNDRTQSILKNIKIYFPRFNIYRGTDIFTKEKSFIVELYLPNITNEEKGIFLSIIYNIFQNDIIKFKRYLYDGFVYAPLTMDYLDYGTRRFFYTEDLFSQFFIYTKHLFGDLRKSENVITNLETFKYFWSKENNLDYLVELVQDRCSREQIDFNSRNINNLIQFHIDLEKITYNSEEFKESKTNEFFKRYIKAIKFIPNLQAFGFGQYYLFFQSDNLDLIDFKLLFSNAFQGVKYSATFDTNISLMIKYLFPYRNPNLAYINWLVKSKKIVSEYCFFLIRSLRIIFHFDFNLSLEGWDLDANNFKTYLQKILFDPIFNIQFRGNKEFNIGNSSISNYYGKNSEILEKLELIYSQKATDLKSILGTRKKALFEPIEELINKKLIFPYLKLKNLGLIEKLYILLLDVKREHIEKLFKAFNFFNFAFFYEIEGEFFIRGFPDVKTFENGVLIKLYLPDTDLSEFQKIFDLLFHYLDIEYYLILNDLFKGETLIKSVYGNLKFLETYNPLKNFIWNDKDKIWMNHKLFGENFEPKYPDLIPKENENS